MTAVQEFSYLRVPEKSAFSTTEDSTSLPGSSFLAPAAFSIAASKHYTGWEALDNASSTLSNIGKGNQFAEWACGNQNKSPFKEKDIWEIKGNAQSLWEKFSSSLLAQSIVRTILIADSYLEYFSFLKSSEKLPGNVPIWDMIVPAAKLYAAAQKSLKGIEMINEAKCRGASERGYGTLVSGAADAVSAASKIAAIYFLYQISPLAELMFMTASYVGSIFELSRDKKAIKMETLDEIVKQKPTVMIPV